MFAKYRKLSIAWLSLCVFSLPSHGQTYTVVYRFANSHSHGAHPYAGVIQDAAGILYGTTWGGGPARLGTVFKLDPVTGEETVLHSFLGAPDGARPKAALIMDSDGNLYGTTRFGGAFNWGTVFELDAAGNFNTLYNFRGGSDGAEPLGALVRDSAGNLYGTTYFGGRSGKGTVFKIDSSGGKTILYNFAGSPDGALPAAGLVQDAAGNLYGTTRFGGTADPRLHGLRAGTVFRVSPNGGGSVIFDFTQERGNDGIDPMGALIFDSENNLYGTTRKGGPHGGGTVFRFNVGSGEFTLLHAFSGPDGANPHSTLVRDTEGNLFGTTASSSGCVCGVVFKLDPSGVETLLHTFTGGSDGRKPIAGLWMDSENNLYGTTLLGEEFASGTVFEITP